jgi:hypothetical protein
MITDTKIVSHVVDFDDFPKNRSFWKDIDTVLKLLEARRMHVAVSLEEQRLYFPFFARFRQTGHVNQR